MKSAANFTLLLVLIILMAFVGLCLADEHVGYVTYYTRASCQREGTSGVTTASGEGYDEAGFTCALPWRGFGGRYRLTNVETGRAVVVRHTDFGPGRAARARGVVVDVTPAVFDALGFPRGCNGNVCWGRGKVKVERM